MAEASYAATPNFCGEICVEDDSENNDESVVDPIPDDLFAIYNNLFDSSDDLSDFEWKWNYGESSDISTSSENEQ